MKSKATLCISIASLFGVAGCSGPTSEEISKAKEQCTTFYKENRAHHTNDVKAIDDWMKDGKLVIELAVREQSWSSSYKSGLCIYDKEKGTISIPSVFEQGRWSK